MDRISVFGSKLRTGCKAFATLASKLYDFGWTSSVFIQVLLMSKSLVNVRPNSGETLRQREVLIEFYRKGKVDEAVCPSKGSIWKLLIKSLIISIEGSLLTSLIKLRAYPVRVWFIRYVSSPSSVPFRDFSRVVRGEIRILIGIHSSEVAEVFQVCKFHWLNERTKPNRFQLESPVPTCCIKSKSESRAVE